MSVSQKDVISGLKASGERVGRLYPILLDKHGNLVDGRHRLALDENWPRIRLEHVETEEGRLVARLISNVCRRQVPAGEKREILQKLGEIYLHEGVKPGKIALKIAEMTGMSYRWVMKYLPDKLKERPGLGGPSKALCLDKGKENRHKSKVAHLATEEYKLLLDQQHKILTVKNYTNTRFVNIIVEKPFYKRVEKIAEELGATPDTIINNALLATLKKLEDIAQNRTKRCF
jgi:ParB-like chromosome segregation protein Spo0J